jgi:hypothetical protein
MEMEANISAQRVYQEIVHKKLSSLSKHKGHREPPCGTADIVIYFCGHVHLDSAKANRRRENG